MNALVAKASDTQGKLLDFPVTLNPTDDVDTGPLQ